MAGSKIVMQDGDLTTGKHAIPRLSAGSGLTGDSGIALLVSNAVERLLGQAEVSDQRQGSAILQCRSDFIALLFEQRPEQVVSFECRSFFYGTGGQIAIEQLGGQRIVATGAIEDVGSFPQNVGLGLRGVAELDDGLLHFVEAFLAAEKRARFSQASASP